MTKHENTTPNAAPPGTYGVVYNIHFGGYDLNNDIRADLRAAGIDYDYLYDYDALVDRHDPRLVDAVLRDNARAAARGDSPRLDVAYVPEGQGYYISEYDGAEEVITIKDFIFPQ
jgi:hypothetical protein